MNELSNLKSTVLSAIYFEELIKNILSANGWIIQNNNINKNNIFDVVAIQPNSTNLVAFEVKFTRNNTYPTSALINATKRLVSRALQENIENAVLVVAADIKKEIKIKIENEFKVKIIDLNELLTLAIVDLDLFSKVIRLIEIDISERNIPQHIKNTVNPLNLENVNPATEMESDDKNIGEELLRKLSNTPTGRDDCYTYETVATDILKYLFDNDLTGWYVQKKTSDDLHRYDLICRVVPNSNVWRFIANDLDSRYILFEFKNYTDEINQGQVYSTEKYLYEKAKRKACFLVTRKGASENAKLACAGAMREHGKLIITLSDKDLEVFINSKIAGDDHNELLFDIVDKFMMELPR